MKKLIIFMFAGLFALASYGQSGVLHGPGGLWIGNATTLTPVFKIGVTPITTTAAQFNYLNTLTSNVQTQLNDVDIDTAVMLTPYSHKLNPTFTGVPAAPTAALNTNTTQLATTAFVTAAHPVDFTLIFDPVSCTTPLDNTLYYYGVFNQGGLVTTANVKTVIIPFNCTLVGYSLVTKSTVACSAETGTLSVRINNTTDVQLSTAITWGVGGGYALNWFSSAVLNTNITAGDKIEMKLLTPTWATDATVIYLTTILYFKNR